LILPLTLEKLDLILNADSLSKLFKLVFITRRAWVVITCLLWLFINILAQAGIAAVSLTYGFDNNDDAVTLSSKGNITLPDMSHFFPSTPILNTVNSEPDVFDEQYTAHVQVALLPRSSYFLTCLDMAVLLLIME
jgi:hypothetical protein